jgi:archaemetzincin
LLSKKRVAEICRAGFHIVNKLESYDIALERPQPGEWLFEHEESGQSFEQYIKSKPISPYGKRKNIYLLPIGSFSPEQERIILSTAEYLKIFFNLETIISPAVSEDVIPKTARRTRSEGYEQLLTSYILDEVAGKNIPPDAIVVMAITSKDLYPSDSWNFVFGQARLKKRVGVSSMFRYSDAPLDSSNFHICLERFIKTSSHEIGHMFSCQHCTHAVCGMNGSNSLYEADARPNRLCSDYMKKLYWNLGLM